MRINTIPPSLLADQHLRAEFVELRMLKPMLMRTMKSKKGLQLDQLPKNYTLNAGHGKFFYDKFGYVQRRFVDLISEMRNRGYNPQALDLDFSDVPINLFGDFTPSEQDMKINLERIKLRISQKPEWYKYRGKSMDWSKIYSEFESSIQK